MAQHVAGETGRWAAETGRWAGEDVRVADISAALAELRARAADDAPRRLGSVLNLVAVAPDAGGTAGIERAIDGLADAHPSRVIVVTAGDRDRAGRIDATCRLTPGPNGGACVEWIGLSVSGPAAAAASAVTSLLRASLPTYLWWPRADAPTGGWQPLADGAARVIFGGDGGPAPGRLARLVRWQAEGAAIGDLAWAALTPWRRLVAQLVDGGAWRRLQSGPSRLRLTGGGLEADLMAGWLGWLLGPALTIEHEPIGSGLRRVALTGPRGGHLHIECPGEGDVAEVTADWPGSVARRRGLPLPRRGPGALLADELTLRGRDRILEAAVGAAAARA